jgi:DNA polymerase I-like protein with 3'-5' exonuclease and polymerase domains
MVAPSRPPESGLEALAYWINERHRVYLRRQAGEPEPWTADPLLQRPHRYCNVFRELDRGTIWLREHWRTPFADHPDLWFAMVAARLINRPDTLAELGFPSPWDPKRVLATLRARQARGAAIFSNAYRTVMVGPGESRVDRLVEVLDLLHRDPPPIEQARTLEQAFGMLAGRPGIGPFAGYETVSDLRWTRYLHDAPDIMTWANAGPGAIRGLHAVWGRPVGGGLPPAQALDEMRLLLKLLPDHLGDHVPPLELRDVEHSLCELWKYERLRRGLSSGSSRSAARVRSARSVSSVIASAARQGVRFRFCGDELEVDGLGALDRTRLEQLLPEIADHLRDPEIPGDPEALLDALDIQIELIEDMTRAAAVIAELPAEVGLDLETMARGPLEQPWLVLTKTGSRAARQPTAGDAPLDPFRGAPRLISVYDPGRRTAFVFDVAKLGGCPAGLLERRVVGHNLLFDLAMLGAQGLAPASSIDTLQLAAMHLPPRKRSLAEVAEHLLELELPKALGRSNWAAPELSTPQLAYAGADPAVAYLAGKRMYAGLEERERTAFAVANRAVPAIVRLRLRGLPFDPQVHARVIDGWQREFAERRGEFEELTGSPAPISSNAVRAWLTERLSEDARQRWPRTESGALSTEAAEIKRMALDWPEVRPLLALRRVQKRIEAFGHSLIDLISPTTGRLHGDYSLPMVTGRMSCSRPNLQNLPADARVAVRAGSGKRLLVADLNQIELRAAGELSGDSNMRAAFAAGEDLHDRFATMMRPGYAALPEKSPERALERKRAKAGHFGTLFAQTTPGFRKYAWKAFDLELPLDEAATVQGAFHRMYPAIGPYQQDQFRRGRWGVLYSVAGRPNRACWAQHGHMWLQRCANYAIQASAADVLLEALRRVDQALPGTLVAAIHDELVLEVDEDQAERAARILEAEMVAAFQRWFPEAPILGLVKVETRSAWHEPEGAAIVTTDERHVAMMILPNGPTLYSNGEVAPEAPDPTPPRRPRRRLPPDWPRAPEPAEPDVASDEPSQAGA